MDYIKVSTSGDKQVRLALRAVIKEIGDLKVMQQLAQEAAHLAARYAPKKTGRLAISIRGNRNKTKAVVTAGKGFSRKYAGRVNYGDPKRWPNFTPRHFMQRASTAVEPRAVVMIDRAIDQMIDRKNFR